MQSVIAVYIELLRLTLSPIIAVQALKNCRDIIRVWFPKGKKTPDQEAAASAELGECVVDALKTHAVISICGVFLRRHTLCIPSLLPKVPQGAVHMCCSLTHKACSVEPACNCIFLRLYLDMSICFPEFAQLLEPLQDLHMQSCSYTIELCLHAKLSLHALLYKGFH